MLTCDNLSLCIEQPIFSNIFSNVNFTLLPGAITMLRGKNGIGKTSLFRIIAGIQQPTKGAVYFANRPILKSKINYLGHELALKFELSVEDNLLLWSKLYNSELMLASAIRYFQLEEILQVPVYKLSSGLKRRVGLSRLMSCNAKIWLLDEVEVNLDETNINLLSNCVTTKANSGGIILWASHYFSPSNSTQVINLEDFSE